MRPPRRSKRNTQQRMEQRVQQQSAAATAHLADRIQPLPPPRRAPTTFRDLTATSYGSEGWRFESLRARPGQQPIAILRRPLLLPKWPSSGPEQLIDGIGRLLAIPRPGS